MRLGLSMWSYVAVWRRGEIEAPDFMRIALELGAGGVELLDFFFRNQGDWSAETDAILKAQDETGLPVGVFSVANDFSDPRPKKRQDQAEVIHRGVDQAVLFGAGLVRVFAGAGSQAREADEVVGWFVEGLSQASVYASEKGVRLALENHGKFAGRGDQIVEIIERVREKSGNDALGANPDTGNFLLVNQDPVEGVRLVAPYAYMGHFKDFAQKPEGHSGHSFAALDGSEFIGTPIGEGSIDLAGCVRALAGASFDGWLNVEYEADEDPITGVPRSMKFARTVVTGAS
ncbi:MAG: sugar phosphate isomerase/epimerase [Armatimonadetes bacterium]|nr:sugar phosphate isomerase/epimerase [Armatimonadota bacterium]